MPRAKRIPSGDFVPYAPSAVGEQVNVNHTDCTAGTDTKQRLYVKRTEAGLVAFCHNCGLGGWFIEKGGRVRKAHHIEIEPPPSGNKYDVDSFGGVRHATGERHEWLRKYLAFRPEAVHKYIRALILEAVGVDGHPLVYLMLDSRGGIYGYQLRWVDGRLPKTKTYLNKKPSEGGWYGNIDAKTVVIVEDPLSAAIVSATMGTKVAVHCLFGTKLSPLAEAALERYKRIIIWLDDDTPGIKASGSIFGRLLYVHGSSSTIVNLTAGIATLTGKTIPQPKEHLYIQSTLEPYV